MNGSLASAHRLVLLTLALSAIAVVAAHILSGAASLLVAATLCALLWLLRPVLLPPGYGAMKVRTLSVLGIFGLAASYGFWSQLVDAGTKTLGRIPQVQQAAPWLEKVDLGSGPSVAVLVFVAIGLWIVNHYMADRTIAGGHPAPMATDFPEQTFQRKLDSFCSALRQHLVTTDREANWSPDYYADLEAEVEIVLTTGSAERRRIVDLQGALRSDRSTQAFLILGDPGAGKSVALRKLARDMLDEVGKTGRVPIYINLREWLPKEGKRNTTWTEAAKPTVQELESFVIDNIKARGDVFTEEFVDQYFRDLWKHGRLFFLFDSFDEIPELLDIDEESWLINALSDVLSRFISSSSQSRGVLASRVFRRPTQAFLAQKILDIRPMSEERIVQALGRFPAFTQQLQFALFRDRLDLVPIARNPFLMALLGEWVKDHRALPRSQADLYKNYLNGRLEKCASKISQAGLAVTDVLLGAKEIAWFVFESPAYGLEAPVRVIQDERAIPHAAAIIDVLSYARIARVTQSDPKSFAFVHRRFLEYLVTTRLLDRPDDLPVEHIPTDSRGRDALVLYAQLCDDESANKLAALCWSEIKTHFHDNATHLRAIHSLRFLTDAFRSRRAAVTPFAPELVGFIQQHVEHGKNLVQAKICLEGTGLLSETEAMPILNMAMAGNNSWLQETAFRACRHLPLLDLDLQHSIARYVVTMPLRQFWANRSALTFSLSLSESLKDVHRTVVLRYRNLLCSAIAIPLALLAAPMVGLLTLSFTVQSYFASFAFSNLLDLITPLMQRMPSMPGTRLRNMNRSVERVIMLSANRGLDDWQQAYRILLGSALAVSGIALATASQFFPSYEAKIKNILFIADYPIPGWLGGLVAIFLGTMVLDWLIVRAFWKGLLRQLNRPFKTMVPAFFFLLMFALMLYVTFLFFKWLQQSGLKWILVVVSGLMAAVISISMLWGMGKGIYRQILDRHTFNHISITDRMPRAEIIKALNSLTTFRWRLAFIRQLAQRKTMATENWPAEFSLSVVSDPAITELAKLEERWLRLDR